MIQMNLFTKRKQTHRLTEGTYACGGEEGQGKGIVKDQQVHAAVFKMESQQEPSVQHRERCSMLCGSLDGRGIQGRRDTHVCMSESFCQGKHTDWNHPPWPDTTVCLHELFLTGGPGKEQETNKPPPTGSVRERSKGDTTCPTTSQNPSCSHPSWLNKVCTTRKDPASE